MPLISPCPGVVADVLAGVILGCLLFQEAKVFVTGEFQWRRRENQHPATLEMVCQLVQG